MEPLELAEVALLVGMVKTGGRSGRWWAMKARVIIALATYLDGEWWNAPDVERLTGIPAAHARRVLLELVEQKVILRDGGHGAAAKVFWCEVNPDWRAWDVEWSMTVREIETRLEYARATWVRHPLERLFSRPAGARYHRVIALLSARAFERDRARMRPVIARAARAITEPGSRALTARSRGRRAQEVSLLARGADAGISSLAAQAKAQEEEGMQHPEWRAVRRAYCTRAGVPMLYGSPSAALARLVATYGPEQLLTAIDRAPEGLGVSYLVDHLGEALAHPEELATVIPIEDAGRQRARVEHLEQMVATYRAEGAEPPEVLLAELARWQDGPEVLEEA